MDTEQSNNMKDSWSQPSPAEMKQEIIKSLTTLHQYSFSFGVHISKWTSKWLTEAHKDTHTYTNILNLHSIKYLSCVLSSVKRGLLLGSYDQHFVIKL